MRLNPPSIFVFLISLVLAILALVSKFGAVGMNVPRYLPHQEVLAGSGRLHGVDGRQSGAWALSPQSECHVERHLSRPTRAATEPGGPRVMDRGVETW